MQVHLVVVLLLSVSFYGAFADDQVAKDGTVKVKLIGQGGGILVGHDVADFDSSSDTVKIFLKSAIEHDDDGNPMSDKDHSYSTFSGEIFTVTEAKESKYPDTNIPVKKFDFYKTLSNKAKFKVTVYLFTGAGNIGSGNSEMAMKKGMVKWNIEIEDWKFKASSKSPPGGFLDVKMEIRNNVTAKEGGIPEKREFMLGSGSVMTINNKVDNGGKNEIMPAGFPKENKESGKTIFTFRFNRFDDYVIHDPTITLGDVRRKTTTAKPTAKPTTGASNRMGSWETMAALIALLVAIL